MIYICMALALLISTSIEAYTTIFAPYDGPFPVSLDSRFEGIIWRRPNWTDDIEDSFNWHFKGYIKLQWEGVFLKTGASVVTSRIPRFNSHFERTGVDLQLGKYWQGIAAIRGGLLYDGPGIGGDIWVIYKDQFKWLTTLECAANKVHEGYHYDSFKPFIKWLNRFIVFGGIYISWGINHIGSSKSFKDSRTHGFLGFGATV